MRYLYYYGSYGRDLYRKEITRETEHTIWMGKTRISKKTYSTGTDWNRTNYMEENEKIKLKFIEHNTKLIFLNKLEELKSCRNMKVMTDVININVS